MARYLFYGQPGSLGHVLPVVPVLQRLIEDGHEVRACIMEGAVALLQREAIAASPIDTALEHLPARDWRARTRVGALLSILDLYAERAPHESDDLERQLRDFDPDVVIVDSVCFGAAARAEASGLPWALFAPHLLPIPSRSAPPFGPALKPTRGTAGRLRDGLVGWLIGCAYSSSLRELNRLRLDLGVAPLERGTDHYTRPRLTLCATIPEFDYPHTDWPDSIKLIGPCIWEPDAAPPAVLRRVNEPLVFVTLSSDYQADESLLTTALEAFQHEPVSVVATTAGAKRPSVVPHNAIIERHLPHAPLVARAGCVVCHGGMGITQKALAAGVPLCIVPFGRDQPEVARRVERLGAGVTLPARRLNPDRMRRAVREAMTLRPAAERVAHSMRAFDGAQAGASALQQLANQTQRVIVA